MRRSAAPRSLRAVAARRIRHPRTRRLCLLCRRRGRVPDLLGVEPIPPVGGDSLPALNLRPPLGVRHARWFCHRRPRLPLLRLGGISSGNGTRGRILLRRHGGMADGWEKNVGRRGAEGGKQWENGGKVGKRREKACLSLREWTHASFGFGRRPPGAWVRLGFAGYYFGPNQRKMRTWGRDWADFSAPALKRALGACWGGDSRCSYLTRVPVPCLHRRKNVVSEHRILQPCV